MVWAHPHPVHICVMRHVCLHFKTYGTCTCTRSTQPTYAICGASTAPLNPAHHKIVSHKSNFHTNQNVCASPASQPTCMGFDLDEFSVASCTPLISSKLSLAKRFSSSVTTFHMLASLPSTHNALTHKMFAPQLPISSRQSKESANATELVSS